MNALISLMAVVVLVLIALVGVQVPGLNYVFAVVIPYAAAISFVAGIVYRVWLWAQAPVPFRITTTCGQQTSLPWIRANKLDNPSNTGGVVGRMLLEVLLFRSLFRNTSVELEKGPRLLYTPQRYLWLGALAFHWSFLIIFVRHLRFLIEPVPGCVIALTYLDSFFQIGVPILFATDVIIVAAVTYLFLRRILDDKLRYISLASDYFPLLLILGIAITGILMRYTPLKTEIVAVKEVCMGLLSLQPGALPEGISTIFYIHLFLVCVLFAYFPYSKLLHAPGVFLSPTRNLANNNRAVRHVNVWNYDVNVHTYDEWEEENKDVLKSAGYTLERE